MVSFSAAVEELTSVKELLSRMYPDSSLMLMMTMFVSSLLPWYLQTHTHTHKHRVMLTLTHCGLSAALTGWIYFLSLQFMMQMDNIFCQYSISWNYTELIPGNVNTQWSRQSHLWWTESLQLSCLNIFLVAGQNVLSEIINWTQIWTNPDINSIKSVHQKQLLYKIIHQVCIFIILSSKKKKGIKPVYEAVWKNL